MTNEWLPNPGTGNPVREGETLTVVRFRNGKEKRGDDRNWHWGDVGGTFDITHYQVSPPRVAEPATMSADEVLIRAREATIEAWKGEGDFAKKTRSGVHDRLNPIKAIIVYERDRAKPLAEVAPHTVEDADEKAAYDLYVIAAKSGYPATWENRDRNELYLGFRAAIKRGRELERGA